MRTVEVLLHDGSTVEASMGGAGRPPLAGVADRVT